MTTMPHSDEPGGDIIKPQDEPVDEPQETAEEPAEEPQDMPGNNGGRDMRDQMDRRLARAVLHAEGVVGERIEYATGISVAPTQDGPTVVYAV